MAGKKLAPRFQLSGSLLMVKEGVAVIEGLLGLLVEFFMSLSTRTGAAEANYSSAPVWTAVKPLRSFDIFARVHLNSCLRNEISTSEPSS
ncbi:hypothetical protein Trydic_g1383 [Trypoxylus dichotomus]